MTGFLYFIFFSVVFYYVFKFSMRLLAPFLMKKLAERMMKKAQQSQHYTQHTYGSGGPFAQSNSRENAQQNAKGDPKVRVDYMPPREEKRKGPAVAGEFVDFEEVK